MKNTDIFSASEGYDMVVSVTQQTINDQLATLANPDIAIIKNTILFGLARNAKKERVAKFYQKWSDVPQDSDGTPTVPVISAEYLPQIQITASGTTVALVLELDSGSAWFVDPVDGTMGKTEITGWKYGIAINLDFAGISRDALNAGIAAPPIVVDRLNSFVSADFAVSQLFVDLTDVNLIRSDPEITTVGTAGPDTLDMFTLFMAAFLKAIQDDPKENPFILGYTICAPTGKADEDKDVPPTLKPIGQTFTVYHEPTNADMSTVNFCLNTAGGQSSLGNGVHATPGNFDTNWLGPLEQCDAKMIYSHFSLLETLILRPFYDNFSSSCHSTISTAGVSISDSPTYSAACGSIPFGRKYDISNVSSGDDQYINQYTVVFGSDGTRITLKFSGSIRTTKTVSQNEFFCTATASATGFVNWEASMTIEAQKDAQGKPVLTVSNASPSVTSSGQNSDMNKCAESFAWIGKIMGGILDAFQIGLDSQFFEKLFSKLLVPTLPGLYNIDGALNQMGTTVNNSLVLPAGQEFFFKSPVVDESGNVSLELTYKTTTGALKSTHSPTKIVEGYVSRRTRLEIEEPKQLLRSTHVPSLLQAAGPATPNANAQPLFDKFKFAALKPNESTYDMSISCELMSNTAPGMPVVPTQEFRLVQDDHGKAVIFAMGTNNHLNVLIGKSGTSGAGFEVLDLGQDFTAYKNAVCFAVNQDGDGKISVAFVLNDHQDAQTVFYAPRLSNNLKVTDFSMLSHSSTKITGFDIGFVAQKMLVGPSADGQRPELVISGQLNGQKCFYQLRSDDASPSRVEFPENVSENLLSLQMGYAFAARANFFLYENGETTSLISKTIATTKKKSVVFDYSPGNTDLPAAFQNLKYNSISTVVSRTGQFASSDILIAAATGVYRIPNGKAAGMECVTDKIIDGHEIFATTTSTTVSLWVVASPNILWYISGTKQQDGLTITWGTPFQFATGVIHVAGMRSFVDNSNEIFTINQDLSIKRYWQDPTTTNWSSKTEAVPKSDYVVNYDSYTTQIHVETNGLPLAGAKLLVSSSEWQYYTINGLIYSLDKDTSAELTTDALGNITIIAAAIDIAPCILHVQSSLFAETMNIYPNGKIHHHLSNVTDGASLRSATAQDGTPIVGSNIDDTTADGVAANITQVKTKAADEMFLPAKQGNIFTAIEVPTSNGGASHLKHHAMAPLKVKHTKDKILCGMVVVNGKWQSHEEGQAAQMARQSLTVNSVEDFFGDIWHWLENFGESAISTIEDGVVKLKDGASFVLHQVGEGLEFVLKGADFLLRIALKVLSSVFKALAWILKLVGIDLKKILAWLGHLLGWDHVWATHQMISGMSTAFLDFATETGVGYIEQARAQAKSLFATINADVRNAILPASIQNEKQSAAADSVDQSNARSVASCGATNYSYYQLQHGVTSSSPASASAVAQSIKSDAVGDSTFMLFYKDVVEPAFETISDHLGTTANDLLKLINMADMQSLKELIADLADLIISVIATVVDGFLKVAEDVLKDIKGMVQEELDIPIIGALWDFINDLFGDGEPLTVLNAVSLMLAIPACTAIKLATGTTPDEMNQGFDSSTFPAQVQSWLGSSSTLAPSVLSETEIKTAATADSSGFQCPPMLKDFTVIQGTLAPMAAIAGTIASIVIADAGETPMVKKFETGCNLVKAVLSWPVPDDDQNWAMYGLRWLAWLLGTAADLIPEVPSKAKVVANVVLAILAVVTDAVEGQGPLMWASDLGGSIASLVAEAGGENPEVQIPGYAASIMFGSLLAFAGGVVEYLTLAQSPDTESLVAAFATASVAGNKGKVWKSINVGGA